MKKRKDTTFTVGKCTGKKGYLPLSYQIRGKNLETFIDFNSIQYCENGHQHYQCSFASRVEALIHYSDEDKPHNFLLTFLPENRVLASSNYVKVPWHSSPALFFLPKPTNLHFRMTISPHTRVALGLGLPSEICKLQKASLAINFNVCPLFSSLVQTLNPL